MPSARALARLDVLVWTLIFGGLFMLVLGLASRDEAAVTGWSLIALGGAVAAAGAILIYVRSRLRETPPASNPQDKESRP